jgi:8-amino-3,8-dideoxy-alpha-D-manno-octulosonate transaminase
LINESTIWDSGWPFKDQEGRRKVVYDAQALPNSAEIMNRLLVYQVPVKLSEERLQQIDAAMGKASAAIG